MKILSTFLIIILIFSLSVEAQAGFLSTKTAGKLTMVAILTVTAFVVKIMVRKDQKQTVEIHKRLGEPDRVVEFQEGFDHWRLEWYGDRVYVFCNGVLRVSP